MRDFIFPIVLAVAIIVIGVFLAVQPIVDPGYVHPLALCLTGVGAAIIGGAFLVWALMAALMDKRDLAWSRASNEAVATSRQRWESQQEAIRLEQLQHTDWLQTARW